MIVTNAYLHSIMYYLINALAIMEWDFTMIQLLKGVAFVVI